jgi:hypothetical protein
VNPLDLRLNIPVDAELLERVKLAALRLGLDRGEAMSVSEWVREACTEKLEREEKGR